MSDFINWATFHNTLIIQIVFSIILLLLLFYIYRIFFVTTRSSTSGGADGGADLNEVHEKLDKILKIRAVGIIPGGADKGGAAAAAVSPAMASELEQLKAENAKLKVQLNESEKKVFELTPTGAAAAPVEAAKPAVSDESAAKIAELTKAVDDLQSRLSEYDIIADDIAELSQLRAENAELKKQIASGGGAPQAASTAAAAPVAATTPDSTASANLIEPGMLDALESLETLAEATPTTPIPIPTEAAPSSPEQASPSQNEVKVDQVIPDIEKDLMTEFEKSTQKG